MSKVDYFRRLAKGRLGMGWLSLPMPTTRNIRILFKPEQIFEHTCYTKELLFFILVHKLTDLFRVTDIPWITAHPQNVTKKEGDNATLICYAIGNPVPKISWNKGGLPLSNNSRVSLSMDNKQMTITDVKRVDSGEYGCVATNSLGNDASNPAYLGVQCKWNI